MNIDNLKIILNKLRTTYFNFIKKNKKNIENFLLTYIYLFAFNNLIMEMNEDILNPNSTIKSFINEIYALVFFNKTLSKLFFSASGTKSKGFIGYYLMLQFVIAKNVFALPLIVRYNLVLLLLIEMVNYACKGFLDFFDPNNFAISKEDLINTSSELISLEGNECLFLFVFCLYFYCFYKAIFRKIPYIPYFTIWNKSLKSISYWFQKE